MGSLFEELEAREAAARVRVEELEAAIAELAGKLALAQDGLERLRITRETVAEGTFALSGRRSRPGPVPAQSWSGPTARCGPGGNLATSGGRATRRP